MSETRKLGAKDLIGEDIVKVPVDLNGVGGTFHFKRVPVSITDKFGEMTRGDGNRRKPNVQGAREYLFKQVFSTFEFDKDEGDLALDLAPGQTERDFFLMPEFGRTVDTVLGEYLSLTRPEVGELKK
jgi:hypothetical protein